MAGWKTTSDPSGYRTEICWPITTETTDVTDTVEEIPS